MSTLRVSNIEAKAFPSSPSVDEKVKVTNSNGDILLHLDGTTSGIGSIGIGTTGTTFRVDPNQTVTFPGTIISSGIITAASFSGPITGTTGTFGGNVTISGNLGVAGTVTYEDVARVDATGVSTFREGFYVGPLAGIAATHYKDGSIRSTGIITASSFVGDGSSLSNLPPSAPVGGATTNKVFFNNDQTVWNSYTIPANTNSGTFGPVTVAAGQTVTIPSGSYWTIV